MRILGIETSCDDTAAAIFDGAAGLVGHRLASQVALHQPYGGVVPELAARDHIRTLLPLVDDLLCDPANGGAAMDAVAYTAGPGLAGALLVGAAVANGLARAWAIPAVGIHHMEGHLLAPMLEAKPPPYPFIALLVSGGHSLLVAVAGAGQYHILGGTRDDAAGEAFDKTAKILGLGYPGGPAIARAAVAGDPDCFTGAKTFPRPMTKPADGLDFSFSGLKTHARSVAQQQPLDTQRIADIALAFELAVVDTVTIKCQRALAQSGYQRLVVAGGVAANQRLRARLCSMVIEHGGEVFYPRPEFCTDNAAMIAYAGHFRLTHGLREGREPSPPIPLRYDFSVKPRWSLMAIDEVASPPLP